MPDAWDILYDNSSLDNGDAWEHLNAQEGGSGEVFYGIENGVSMSNETKEIQITESDSSNLTVVDNDIKITLISDELYQMHVNGKVTVNV